MEGIDATQLTAWFEANVEGVDTPLSFERLVEDQGRLTVAVSDVSGRRWVLRRGPAERDVVREHQILQALSATAVPAASPVGYCADESVNGAAFSVRAWVDGHVVVDANDATKLLDEAARATAGLTLVDALAAVHAVDVEATGLADLGSGPGLVTRQLDRWHRQVIDGQAVAGRCLLLLEDLHRFLALTAPPEPTRPVLLHGDFRLDNAVLGDDGAVVALLDWKSATLGDPLVDLGQLLVYWTDPGQENDAMGAAPTAVAGFPARRALVERYAERSGLDLDRLDFYMALAYWKLACILEGMFALARADGGADPAYLDALSHQAVRLAESGRDALSGA